MRFRLNAAQSTYLNLARGLAALVVLIGHASRFFLIGGPLAASDIQAGAVLVFFLLSGFLISYSVFQKHDDPHYGFRDYFIDRFTRIFCAFIPALLFVAVLDHISAQLSSVQGGVESVKWTLKFLDRMDPATFIGNLFMMQDFPAFQVLRRLGMPENKFFIDKFGSANPFWTICIEWWIYMVFGGIAVWRVKMKQPFRLWHWPILGFVAIEPFYYLIGGYNPGLTLLWIVGMCAALLFLRLPEWAVQKGIDTSGARWFWFWLAAAGFAIVSMFGRLFALKFDRGSMEFGELHFGIFLALALFAGLLAMQAVKRVPGWCTHFARFIADYSFSLYLTHNTILMYLYLRYPGSDYSPRMFWVSLVIANIVGIVFWWLFERHYRDIARWLKSRFAKSSKPLTTV